ncbi:MAG: phosphate ABC transporter permease subunit PstC [Tistlia sp.]|uniref:phosphate ABC transporter permease subunit PstC n=1 Tax=Tistlia sp. TaxID=3057121 RepID=UPI0034A10246
MATLAFGAVLLTVLVAFLAGRRRLAAQVSGAGDSHSLPDYHGAFVALWAGLPAFVLVLAWLLLQGPLVESLLVASLPAELVEGTSEAQRNLLVAEIKSIAAGQIFGQPEPALVDAAERFLAWRQIASWAMVACAAALALLGLALARSRVAPEFRARQRVERIFFWLMVFCSTVAVVTTLGILLSLLFEAYRFFERVPLFEFLFGLNWEPQMAIRADQVAGQGAFGAIPVFTGTLLVALLAMLVAGPIGLLSAIYLAEYSGRGFRRSVKPILEILAGVPTIVYGIFAVLTVAPALREAGAALGIAVAPNSALAAGAVMGIMILPFISSLSDDAIAAVPQSLRDGSYALGATKAETIVQVLLPAALPGIVGGFLLAASRAIGETMIVVMAAGLIANLTANPLEAVTTVTVQIVTLLIGDTEFDSPKTLAAFALGLVLFLVTLALNVVALRFVQKYREKYE